MRVHVPQLPPSFDKEQRAHDLLDKLTGSVFVTVLVGLILVAATFIATFLSVDAVADSHKRLFDRVALDTLDSINDSIQGALEAGIGLVDAMSTYSSSVDLSRLPMSQAEYTRITQRLVDEVPGVLGFGFNLRVAPALDNLTDTVLPTYNSTALLESIVAACPMGPCYPRNVSTGELLVPGVNASDMFLASLITDPNTNSFLLDLNSDSSPRSNIISDFLVFDSLIAAGVPNVTYPAFALTEPLDLFIGGFGIIAFVPYRHRPAPERLLGAIAVVYRFDELFETALRRVFKGTTSIAVRAVDAGTGDVLYDNREAVPEEPDVQPRLTRRFKLRRTQEPLALKFDGRTFLIDVFERRYLQDESVFIYPFILCVSLALSSFTIMGLLLLAQRQTSRYNHESQRVVKGMRDITAMATHDLRTPVNALRMGMTLLQDGETNGNLTEDQKEVINDQEVSLHVMQQIIDNVLTHEHIASGCIDLLKPEPVHVNIEVMLANLIKITRVYHSEHTKIETIVTGYPFVHTDERWLQLVVMNYLSNASKHTKEGRILIKADTYRTSDNGAVQLRIEVHDSGKGVPASEQKYLFTRFAQGKEKEKGGIGLGLFTAAQLCKVLGGEYGYRERPDGAKGSVFYATVPVTLCDARTCNSPDVVQERVSHRSQSSNGTSHDGSNECDAVEMQPVVAMGGDTQQPVCLVAEDIHMNMKLLTKVLATMGIATLQAKDGEEMVKIAKTVHDRITFVITDVHMPVMNGWEATEEVRAYEEALKLPRLPIFGWTATKTMEMNDKCVAAGMDGMVSKPFTKDSLIRELVRAQVRPFYTPAH